LGKSINKNSRVFGFNKDREGLISRYLYESKNWNYHLNRTKEYILEAANKSEKNICMILGSGWMLDIPIDELHQIFNTVILVDISHPKQIKHKLKKYPKVKIVRDDISGVLEFIKNEEIYKSENICNELNNAYEFNLINDHKPDLTISLNLLSQIAYFPVKFAEQRFDIDGQTSDLLTECIQKLHLGKLPKNKSIIITDYYQYEYNFKDVLLNESSRLKVDLPEINKEWLWDFDLSGNYINRRKVKFKVAALQV